MKPQSPFKFIFLLVLLVAAGSAAMAQSIVYEPYDFRQVNADGDTLYYRITSDSEPYTVAVTRCHDSTYHQLPHAQYAWQVGQPGYAYPVYDYDSLINIPPTVTNDDVTYNHRTIVKDVNGDSFEEYLVFHQKFLKWAEVNGYDVSTFSSMSDDEINNIVAQSPYYKAMANDTDYIKSRHAVCFGIF